MTHGDRLHLLLRLFTVEKPRWSADEAAAALGVSLSTAYRQFAALLKSGLIEPVTGSRAYVLGPAIIELDRIIRLSDPLIRIAQPAMRRLADAAPVACSVLLCRLYRDRVMCTLQEEKPVAAGTVSYERGRPMPLFRGAPSKTILSQLPARQLAALADAAEPGPPVAWERFRAELADIRKRGFCITYGEVDPGVIGLAVPMPTPGRGRVASLGVACFGAPDAAVLDRVRALLMATAAEIEAAVARADGASAERLPR